MFSSPQGEAPLYPLTNARLPRCHERSRRPFFIFIQREEVAGHTHAHDGRKRDSAEFYVYFSSWKRDQYFVSEGENNYYGGP